MGTGAVGLVQVRELMNTEYLSGILINLSTAQVSTHAALNLVQQAGKMQQRNKLNEALMIIEEMIEEIEYEDHTIEEIEPEAEAEA